MEDIAQAILRQLRVVLLVVLIFVGATLGVNLRQTPLYEASANFMVEQKPGVPQDSDLQNNTEALELILPEVVEAIPTRPAAEEVIRRLGLRMGPAELLENLSVEPEGGTVFIQLSYRDTNPEIAQRIVNAVGVVSSEWIPEAIGRADDITVTMWERASVPTNPLSPHPLRNGLLALVLGLAAGIGLAILMERRAT